MHIHIHILSDIVQRFKVKKIHVDLLFVPVDIKYHFPFQISQKMKLSNDRMLLKAGTGNGERGTGNGEWGTGNG